MLINPCSRRRHSAEDDLSRSCNPLHRCHRCRHWGSDRCPIGRRAKEPPINPKRKKNQQSSMTSSGLMGESRRVTMEGSMAAKNKLGSCLNNSIDPVKYKSISTGFGVLLKEQGAKGLFRGWVPTLLGYSAQGACKFGFYEFFKKYYSDIAGPEFSAKYKTLIYLAGSASAEFIADIALCPFEAVKVRVQTQPGFARGLSDGLPKFVRSEGVLGLYKGIGPLWGRQIPYTMMKFASFETIVELIYKHAVPIPKDQCSKPLQLGVSFAAGYIAGVFCAIVSHPADNLVSFLNNAKGATVGDAVKKMGFVGLCTRGLPLRIVMIGTLTGAQWGIYDAFKVFVGLPTTGGVTPPAAELKELKKLS